MELLKYKRPTERLATVIKVFQGMRGSLPEEVVAQVEQKLAKPNRSTLRFNRLARIKVEMAVANEVKKILFEYID